MPPDYGLLRESFYCFLKKDAADQLTLFALFPRFPPIKQVEWETGNLS
jgi:hypothetical protein